MSKSVKGFYTALEDNPPRIQVGWDSIDQPSSKKVKIVWWCIGDPVTETLWPLQHQTQFFIEVKPGKTYMIAARAFYPFSYLGSWAYTVVEVPLVEDKLQYINLGQVTVIDTPRGPAILLDELREVL